MIVVVVVGMASHSLLLLLLVVTAAVVVVAVAVPVLLVAVTGIRALGAVATLGTTSAASAPRLVVAAVASHASAAAATHLVVRLLKEGGLVVEDGVVGAGGEGHWVARRVPCRLQQARGAGPAVVLRLLRGKLEENKNGISNLKSLPSASCPYSRKKRVNMRQTLVRRISK